jgi:predicted transposase YdaD
MKTLSKEGREGGREEGRKEGKKKGRKEGRKEGKKERKKTFAWASVSCAQALGLLDLSHCW